MRVLSRIDCKKRDSNCSQRWVWFSLFQWNERMLEHWDWIINHAWRWSNECVRYWVPICLVAKSHWMWRLAWFKAIRDDQYTHEFISCWYVHSTACWLVMTMQRWNMHMREREREFTVNLNSIACKKRKKWIEETNRISPNVRTSDT